MVYGGISSGVTLQLQADKTTTSIFNLEHCMLVSNLANNIKQTETMTSSSDRYMKIRLY